MKNIEWLKREVLDLRKIGHNTADQTEADKTISRVQKWVWNNCVDRAYDLIDQLDEPEALSIDREQLIKMIENYIPLHDKTVGDVVDGILGIVKQLPEMEVLSPKWINEHAKAVTYDGIPDETEIVYVDELENLLMPKQELPVIPKFVAEWIESLKSKEINLLENIYDFTHDEDINNYIREQGDELMRAWLNGYTVEEEQKYVVVLGKSIYNTTTYGQIGEVNSEKIMQSVYANEEGIIAPSQYTKSEILEVKDGGSIFERFAVKVEELEE